MEVKELSLNRIKAAKNSRLQRHNDDLSGLMQSIKENGLLQPIGVKKAGRGYVIAYGHRRFMAYSKLGKAKIPCVEVSKKCSETDFDILNLTENIQRNQISVVEAGRYISQLKENGLNEREIAARLGVTPNYVKGCLKAYKTVPEKYKDKVVISSPGKKPPAGSLSFTKVLACSDAVKKVGLNKQKTQQLFDAAAQYDDFNYKKAISFAGALKKGIKPSKAHQTHSLQVRFYLSEREFSRIERKYCINGPFNTVNQAIVAMASGEISDKVEAL